MAYCRWCVYLNNISREGIVDCRYYSADYGSTIIEHKDCAFYIDRSKIEEALKEIKENE